MRGAPAEAGVCRRLSGWPGVAALAGALTLGWVAVHCDLLDGASLDGGWFVDLVAVLALAGLVCGTAHRHLRWWLTWGTGIAVASTGLVAAGAWWIHHAQIGATTYPPSFLVWVWAALCAVGVAVTGWWSDGAAIRATRILTAPVAVFAAFCLIQSHYGYWPTLGTLLGRPAPGQVSGPVLTAYVLGPPVGGYEAGRVGHYGPVTIPSPDPGFSPAQAWVWLPPNFASVPHADLPVIVMLPGIPGQTQDWTRAGRAVAIANRWAEHHGGVAPVMVFVNENGASSRDTECVNGPQGDAETYLTQTVPSYLQQAYGITPDPGRWAVAGFSEGGTCAVGLSVEHPDVYGRFVDLAGDLGPNYGDGFSGASALTHLYGGNVQASMAHDPLKVLAAHHYTGVDGWLSAGTQDKEHTAVVATLASAARAAGITVSTVFRPGGHDWLFASHAFACLYPALVGSLSS